jgi:hypothetical protein
MEIELDQMEQARDICSLALLKYYAAADHIESSYSNWIYGEVAAFVDKGIFMPFFKRYAGLGEIWHELVELTYIEHRTDPKNKVNIHFIRPGQSEAEMCHEPMHHVAGGIFVKAFRLFHQETLTYYITETSENGEKILERQTVKAEDADADGSSLETGFDRLNQMLDYLETDDERHLDEVLTAYDRLDEVTDQLFKLK